ncbi:MAG: PKD domain-containing protein [Candidatus ainarchaeum sp.]|nr:PKD domain-containing protein [Candidatus ainarchaeum sp.]
MTNLIIKSFFLFFFWFLIGISFSVSLISSEVLNPSNGNQIFTDSQDVTVKFSFDGFIADPVKYRLTISDNQNYFSLPTDLDKVGVSENISNCDNKACYDPNNKYFNSFGIKQVAISGDFTLTFHLKQSNTAREQDVFNWAVCEMKMGVCNPDPVVNWSGSETISVLSGNPVMETPVIYDINSGSEGVTQVGKNHSFNVLLNVKDNTDDTGGSALTCTATIGTKSATNNSGATWEQKEMELGPFNALDLGTGSKKVTIVCNDTILSSTKELDFSIIDSKPTVTGVAVSPTTPYPDSEISCQNSGKSDADDPSSGISLGYKWYLNGVVKTGEIASKFKCTPALCPQGTEVQCSITPNNNQAGDEAFADKGTVQGYFSTLTISGPDKAQVGEEVTLTADYTYSGAGTVSYEWDFGDSTTKGTTKSLKHTYQKEGDYEIKLKVKDDKGSWIEKTKSIDIVSANLNIIIKEPLVNADILRNDEYKIRVQLLDNAGKAITSATVTAQLKDGVVFSLPETSSGNYEGTFIGNIYNDAKNFVEVSASVSTGGLNLKSKKSVEIYIVPQELVPILELDTSFAGEPGKETFSLGSKINSVNVCFKDKDSENYSSDINGGKIILQGYEKKEYSLEKEQTCFIAYLDYSISDKDVETGILYFKFDVTDKYTNYVSKTYKSKEYEVKNVTGIIDLEIVEPNEKITTINYGQEIPIEVKIKSEKEIKPLFVYLDDGKQIQLTQDTANKNRFIGLYALNEKTGDKKSIDFVAQAEYNGVLVSAKKTKEFKLSNKLNIEMVNPGEDGSYLQTNLKVRINYENGLSYDANTISLAVDDENVLFEKNTDGIYEADYGIPLFGNASINFSGEDDLGNTVNVEKDLGFVSPLFSATIWLIILLVIIGAIIAGIIYWRVRKILHKAQKGKSIEEYETELETAKKTLSQLTRDMFQQKITQEEFQKQKTELEQKIRVLESKISAMREKVEVKDKQIKEESHNELSLDDKKKALIKTNFEGDVYSKYKDKIEELVNKLKPVKAKYTKEEIRQVLDKEEFPEEVVEEVVKRLY